MTRIELDGSYVDPAAVQAVERVRQYECLIHLSNGRSLYLGLAADDVDTRLATAVAEGCAGG